MTRFVRYATLSGPEFGVVDESGVRAIEGHPFGVWTETAREVPLDRLRLLAPIIPTKVVAVGKNYAAHAQEMGGDVPTQPLLFFKPTTAIIGPGDPILYPTDLTSEVHHEAEVAVVVGAKLTRATPTEAAEGIAGYTAANDVTARDLQRSEPQWARGKGMDTFLPLGPSMTTELDLADTRVVCRVNGQVRQDGTTADLVCDVPTLLSWISQSITLLPTDVVLTGTPAGVGPIEPGDTVEVEVPGIGSLVNPVVVRPT